MKNVNMLLATLSAALIMGLQADQSVHQQNNSQDWQQVPAIYAGTANKISYNKGVAYVGEMDANLLYTSDGAKTWQAVHHANGQRACYFAFHDKTTYFSQYNGDVYRTNDNFRTMSKLSHKGKPLDGLCAPLLVTNNTLIVAPTSQILVSEDGGATFVEADISVPKGSITALRQNSRGTLIATTDGIYDSPMYGILYSNDGGYTWKPSNAPTTFFYEDLLTTVVDDTFYTFAYEDDGKTYVFLKSSDGQNWEREKPGFSGDVPAAVYSMTADENGTFYVVAKDGLWSGTATQWQPVEGSGQLINKVAVMDDNQLLTIDYDGSSRVYSSATKAWSERTGTPNIFVNLIATSQTAAYVQGGDPNGGIGGGLYRKLPSKEWELLANAGGYAQMYAENNSLYGSGTEACVVQYTTDNGQTFQGSTEVFNYCGTFGDIEGLVHTGNRTMVAANLGSRDLSSIYATRDYKKWTSLYNRTGDAPYSFVEGGDGVLHGIAGKTIITSTDGGDKWYEDSQGISADQQVARAVYDPEEGATYLSGAYHYDDIGSLGVYKRKNGDTVWENIGEKLPGQGKNATGIVLAEGYVVVSVFDHGVYIRPIGSDGDWVKISHGIGTKQFGPLGYFDGDLIVGTADSGVFTAPFSKILSRAFQEDSEL